MAPDTMAGVAPPPLGGPRRVQGGGDKPTELIDAARLILTYITKHPEMAKTLHPIADALTKAIRESAAPTTPPRLSAGDLPNAPLTDSPSSGGEDSGQAFQIISRLMGGSMGAQ